MKELLDNQVGCHSRYRIVMKRFHQGVVGVGVCLACVFAGTIALADTPPVPDDDSVTLPACGSCSPPSQADSTYTKADQACIDLDPEFPMRPYDRTCYDYTCTGGHWRANHDTPRSGCNSSVIAPVACKTECHQ